MDQLVSPAPDVWCWEDAMLDFGDNLVWYVIWSVTGGIDRIGFRWGLPKRRAWYGAERIM